MRRPSAATASRPAPADVPAQGATEPVTAAPPALFRKAELALDADAQCLTSIFEDIHSTVKATQ
jgi:hypothetical protein